jgi:predicted transcriptional regulator
MTIQRAPSNGAVEHAGSGSLALKRRRPAIEAGPTPGSRRRAASPTWRTDRMSEPLLIPFPHATEGIPPVASQLRYDRAMKTATIPSVRVEPEFRDEVEAVLAEGETLSQFVEAALRAGVARRRTQAEFIARGLRSRDEARHSGDYVPAEEVIVGLQRKLDTARKRLAKSRK